MVDEFCADLRYAVRSLRKNRAFAVAAIATLAVGIGANTAMFSLFEAILLRPMAVADPERVVAIYTSDYSSTPYGSSSYPDYEDFRRISAALPDIAIYRQTFVSMDAGLDTEMLLAEIVSGNYFPMLGVHSEGGRLLALSDDRLDASPVAVIGHGFWTRRFANDPAIVGRTVRLNGQTFTIVGIADREYTGAMRPHSPDVWISVFASRVLSTPERFNWISNHGSRGGGLLGRLREERTAQEAQAEFDLIAAQLYKEHPQEWCNIRSIDGMVLAFTLVISLLTGILFGLAPALHAVRRDLIPVLKDDMAIGSRRRSRLSRTFVIAQVALSVLLMIVAGLFLRSLGNVSATDIGFEPANMIVMTLNPALMGYNEARGRALYENLLEHVDRLPGVQSASFATTVPLGLMGSRRGTVIEGYQPKPGEDMEVALNFVAPRYFETMRIPVLRGRTFSRADRAGSLPVIVVNEMFARRYWPGMDPLGKRVSADGDRGPFREVIGVVPTGKYNTLGEEPRPYYYVPLWQEYRGAAALHVRTTGDPGAMLPSVRETIRSIDATVPIFDAKTMNDQLLLSLLPARVAGTLLGAFGLVALLLAAVGIYGVMSYSVAQRTREIGVRLALGAGYGDLLRLVLTEGSRLIFIGIVIGGSAALAVTRLLTPLLYGIAPYDPLAFGSAIGVLALTAIVACYIPARRALRIDPVTALRLE